MKQEVVTTDNAKTVEMAAARRKMKNANARNILHRFLKNRAAVVASVIMIVFSLMCVFADYVTIHDYSSANLSAILAKPSAAYWFGTDHLGRDLFSRIVYGGRISLAVGFIAVGIGAFFGCGIGAVSAYKGGRFDLYVMRVLDVFQSIPSMLLAVAISATLGSGISNCMIAVGITNIPRFARVTRASVMTIKEAEYIEAARALGEKSWKIILRHLLPNSLAPIIVQASISMGTGILACSSLSFLGLGVNPPTPEWGSILSEARNYMYDSTLFVLFPGLAIVISIVSMNLIGDGLRDALDPRLK